MYIGISNNSMMKSRASGKICRVGSFVCFLHRDFQFSSSLSSGTFESGLGSTGQVWV